MIVKLFSVAEVIFASFSKTATAAVAVSTVFNGSIIATADTSVGEFDETGFEGCWVSTGATGIRLGTPAWHGKEETSTLTGDVLTPDRDTGAVAWESTSFTACNPLPLDEPNFNPSRASCT